MIVYCCHDLIFSTKVHSTADALGIVCRPARTAEALGNRLDRVDDGKANDAVTAVIVDLTIGEPALELIRLAKVHEASPTVIAFAPHVEMALMNAATKCGADQVMPRGAFSAQLPDLLQTLSQPKRES